MIIKDNIGDWGIVVGYWKGFHKGVRHHPSVRRQHGLHKADVCGEHQSNLGNFVVRFYPLRTPGQV
jgi:hypothetical protein